MGRIKDWFNNLFGKKEPKMLDTAKNLEYSPTTLAIGLDFDDTTTGETIRFINAQDTRKHFMYEDGKKVSIWTAKISRLNDPDDTMLDSEARMISFELPVGMTIKEATEKGIISTYLNSDSAKSMNLSDNRVNHLGSFSDATQSIVQSHSTIKSWVEENLTPRLRQEQESIRIREEEIKRQNEEYRKKVDAENRARREENEKLEKRIREQRKSTPCFERDGDDQYKLNNPYSGEVINLSISGRPQVIKKAQDQTEYLYTAIKQDIPDTTAEIHFIPPNFRFSLPLKIEDMCALANDSRNPDRSRNIALMMEQLIARQAQDERQMYVGGIKLENGSLQFLNEQESRQIIDVLEADRTWRGSTMNGYTNRRPGNYDGDQR